MSSYGERALITRRKSLRQAALAGGGLAALAVAGCGGGKTSNEKASDTPSSQEVDYLKGKPGGKLVMQGPGDPASLVLARSANATIHNASSFTHSGLYQLRNGRPGVDRTDMSTELDLATAMPEQLPDQLTYIVKLKEGVKFQNGRGVTAEDVKYSYERYAFDQASAYRTGFSWLEKVEAPDARTVVFKTKAPFADTLGALAARNEGHIFAKEWEEGPDAQNKLMGSGPFLFVEYQRPVSLRYKRNPDYFAKPWPYFDEVEILNSADNTKKMSEFTSHQVSVSYWFGEEDRDQIKRSRPDALVFYNPYPGWGVTMRVDQPPFNDKRVRQALSMAIDRKKVRDGSSKGEGEDDQVFSWVIKTWGFRKPAELGAAAKYWKYDPQAAKQLFAAAGITQPIEPQVSHWDATIVGQGVVDTATLIQAGWRDAGLVNAKDVALTFAQFASTVSIGAFDGIHIGSNNVGTQTPTPTNQIRNVFWSPPEGVTPPSLNSGHVNDPRLSELVDKQRTQIKMEERKQTWRAMEELMAEEQYRLGLSSITNTFFADPSLKNIQLPLTHVNGSYHYAKYWWFA